MDEVNGQDYLFIFRLQLKKTSSGFGFLCSTKNSLSMAAFNNYRVFHVKVSESKPIFG